MTNSHSYELIASVIHTDLSAPVMEAARKAGCQGGTLIKAREIGSDAGKKLFGMTLSQEKAILLILTPTSLRAPILKSICETVMKGDRRTRSGNFPARGCSGGTDRLMLAEKTASFGMNPL